jgi:hypothetical protein
MKNIFKKRSILSFPSIQKYVRGLLGELIKKDLIAHQEGFDRLNISAS